MSQGQDVSRRKKITVQSQAVPGHEESSPDGVERRIPQRKETIVRESLAQEETPRSCVHRKQEAEAA